MDYDVRLLDDNELPTGTDWAFVKKDGLLLFCIKRSAVTERNLADAWAVARSIRDADAEQRAHCARHAREPRVPIHLVG